MFSYAGTYCIYLYTIYFPLSFENIFFPFEKMPFFFFVLGLSMGLAAPNDEPENFLWSFEKQVEREHF